MPDGYFTRTALKLRGWLPGTIRQYLGEPDRIVPNPQSSSGSPSHLYARDRVLAVESTREFQAQSAQRLRIKS